MIDPPPEIEWGGAMEGGTGHTSEHRGRRRINEEMAALSLSSITGRRCLLKLSHTPRDDRPLTSCDAIVFLDRSRGSLA